MDEGTITRWLKNVGDPVSVGEVLFEIETDKTVLEWECDIEGTLLKILVPAGVSKHVGDPIAVIGTPGENPDIAAGQGKINLKTKHKGDQE
jgi:pyruvate dehydrogenase E2 component (dihydrolipoamide acetyltransferase)